MDTTNVAYTNIKTKKTLTDAKSYADTQIEEAFDALTATDVPTSDASTVQAKLTTYAETLGNHTTTLGAHTSQLADKANTSDIASAYATKAELNSTAMAGATEDGIYNLTGLPNPEPNMTMTNLVQNSLFNNTSNWSANSGNNTVLNNTLKTTGTGTSAQVMAYTTISGLTAGHIMYVRCFARVLNALSPRLTVQTQNNNYVDVSSPVQDTWYSASYRYTLSSGGTQIITLAAYANTTDSNGAIHETKYPVLLDLTNIFGAGKEPSKYAMDTMLLAAYPTTGYFNGSAVVPAKTYHDKKLFGVYLGVPTMVMARGFSNNVKAYGAVADGITDDAAAIQACADANSSIFFPAGTYLLSGITLPSGREIYGEGKGVTILKLAASPTKPMFDIYGVRGDISPYITSDVTFHDLTLRHETSAAGLAKVGALIAGYNTARCTVENVEFDSFGHYGIYLDMNDNDTTMAQGWLINRCTFRRGGAEAVGIYLNAESEYNIIRGCQFHTMRYGVQLLNAANNGVFDSNFLGCAGILSTKTGANCGKLAVNGCKINHVAGIGIEIINAAVVGAQFGDLITGNDILISTGYAIKLNGAQGTVVSNNRLIAGTGLTGISLTDNTLVSDYNSIIGNVSIAYACLTNTATGVHNIVEHNIDSAP